MWVLVLVVIAGGSFLSWWTAKRAETELKKEFLSRAMIVAGSVNPDRISTLKGTEEDLFSTDYHRLKEQLWLVRQVMSQFGILYILGKRDNQIVFLVDSEVQGSEFHSRPGEIYPDSSKAHRMAFETGKEILSEPYTDKWGKWISAIVPIYNRDTTELAGLFCIDIDSRDWSVKVVEHAIAPMLFTVLISFILFFYSLFYRHYDEAQKRIATTEEYMNLAIEGAGLATWEWDLTTGDIISNDRFSQLIGYEGDLLEVKLNRWHHLVHPDEKDHLQEVLTANLNGVIDFFEEEHRLKHSAGHWVWVLNRGRVMERAQDGLPLRIAGTIMDISERKQSEKALKESEARFRRIFEESPMGIQLYDSNGILIQVNRACLDILGVSDPKEIVGLSAYNDPNLLQAMLDSVKNGNISGFEVAYDFDLVKKYGLYKTNRSKKSFLDIFVSSIGVEGSGTDAEFLIHVQDITDRKIAEEERISLEKRIQAAQKMESLGLLAGGVAHDFNNILGALQGFAEMALEIVELRMPGSSANEYLTQVIKASAKAADLVDQILTFSRKSDSVRKPLDIAVVVKETIKLLRPSIPSNISLESKIDSNCGRVLVDPVHVHQVIMNLCANSRHAMGENGGILKIEMSRSAFGEKNINDPEGDYVRICVRDNGCGIPRDNIDRVFDPFFTTKRPGEGTGLGLSVVHGIVIACDGYIFVESELGKGTAICVYLPEAGDKEETAIVNNEDKIKVNGRTPRVLLVDDEKSLLGMINERLTSRGLEVSAFLDPLVALDCLKSRPGDFDIVISDFNLSGLNGMDFVAKARESSPDIPFILMLGRDSVLQTEIHTIQGQFQMIRKPIAFNDLFASIRNFVEHKETV